MGWAIFFKPALRLTKALSVTRTARAAARGNSLARKAAFDTFFKTQKRYADSRAALSEAVKNLNETKDAFKLSGMDWADPAWVKQLGDAEKAVESALDRVHATGRRFESARTAAHYKLPTEGVNALTKAHEKLVRNALIRDALPVALSGGALGAAYVSADTDADQAWKAAEDASLTAKERIERAEAAKNGAQPKKEDEWSDHSVLGYGAGGALAGAAAAAALSDEEHRWRNIALSALGGGTLGALSAALMNKYKV